jgi:hypothetical protein
MSPEKKPLLIVIYNNVRNASCRPTSSYLATRTRDEAPRGGLEHVEELNVIWTIAISIYIRRDTKSETKSNFEIHDSLNF